MRLRSAALGGSTVYASGEPCGMGAAGLFWAGVRRVVFAASNEVMNDLFGGDMLPIECADVLAGASRRVQVDGPMVAGEALAVLQDSQAQPGD